MRSDDDRQPFDIEAHEAADLTQQFWGTSRGWQRTGDDDGGWDERPTRSIRAVTSGLSAIRPRRSPARSHQTGRLDRTRSHGIPRPKLNEEPAVEAHEATLGELAAGWSDDDWPELDLLPTRPQAAVRTSARPAVAHANVDQYPEDQFEDEFEEDRLVPLTPNPSGPVQSLTARLGIGAIDPLLARLGAIVVIGVLLVPFALSARGGDSQAAVVGEVVPLAVGQAAATATATTPVTQATSAPSTASDAPAATAAQTTSEATAASEPEWSSAAVVAASSDTDTGAADETSETAPPATAAVAAATVSEEADRVQPVCALTYVAGPGDSWYRIAESAGITPAALMDANLAQLDTPIFPGDEICLPEGATMPEPPATTTDPPATTTVAPTTTAKPSTTTSPPPPPAPASTAQVQALIREIWPDELEEKALQIAWRESNYRADVYNGSCCYGVFQLHWLSHRSWLDDYGITSTNDLLDARKNITAAYALYQRSGGWGPWGG
jgi:hypothetical protein